MRLVIFTGILFLMTSCQSEQKQSTTEEQPPIHNPQTSALSEVPNAQRQMEQPDTISQQDEVSLRELLSPKRGFDSLGHAAYLKASEAVEKMQQGQLNEAIDLFKASLELKPDVQKNMYNIASAYYQLEDYSQALTWFNQAVDHDPADTASLVTIGLIHYNQGRMQQSIGYFDKALALDTNLFQMWYNRGTAYGRLEDYDKAIADLSRAILLNPDHGNSYLNRGVAYHLAQRKTEACADWQKAAQLGVEAARQSLQRHCE
jgi:tetratricopeptide (TPR) repeat protein